MGGNGSGRYGYRAENDTTDSVLSIDIRKLKKQASLKPAHFLSIVGQSTTNR